MWPEISSGEPWESSNVWLGTSIENQEWADRRMPFLVHAKASGMVKRTFVSAEPLVGSVNLSEFLRPSCWHWRSGTADPRRMDSEQLQAARDRGDCWKRPQALVMAGSPYLDWVITGGESGPNARPCEPEWFTSLRDQCEESGTPFHFKQWGEFDDTKTRVGKKNAGRLLDGVTHDGLPA